MNGILLLVGAVILICVVAHRFTEKLAIPSLLVFLLSFGSSSRQISLVS